MTQARGQRTSWRTESVGFQLSSSRSRSAQPLSERQADGAAAEAPHLETRGAGGGGAGRGGGGGGAGRAAAGTAMSDW